MTLPGSGPWNFHRVIIDESHLLEDSRRGSDVRRGSRRSATCASTYNRRSCGSHRHADPAERHDEHPMLALPRQARPWAGYARQQETRGGLDIGGNKTKTEVDKLKRIMIRHTKKQRIGGEVALALPDCDCRTVLLDMSADELILHRDAACKDGTPRGSARQPTTTTTSTSPVQARYAIRRVHRRLRTAREVLPGTRPTATARAPRRVLVPPSTG